MITPDLISYIETELRRSVTKDAIQNALTGAGWKPTEVAEALRLVDDRAVKNETGTPYVPPVIIKEEAPSQKKDDPNIVVPAESPIHIVSTPSTVPGEGPTITAVQTGFNPSHPGSFSGVTVMPEKSHHGLMGIFITLGVLILGTLGFLFIPPLLNKPESYISKIGAGVTQAKSITFSGMYEIRVPAGVALPDPVLLSFGGLSERGNVATITGSFFGVDDWYDLSSKKSETKLNAKLSVGQGKKVEFPSTIRRVSDSLYIKLPESGALFDKLSTVAGANWVRFDTGDFVPAYGYGFLGGTKLYENSLPRFFSPLFESAIATDAGTDVLGGKVFAVSYDRTIAMELFTEALLNGDNFKNSQIIGASYEVEGVMVPPTGELTFSKNKVLKKATFVMAVKTKDYTEPIHFSLTMSFDSYNVPPAVNIPIQVSSLGDLKNQAAFAGVPTELRSFFSDIHTVAGVFGASHSTSYDGLCTTTATDAGSDEFNIALVSGKIKEAGFTGPVCRDTATAWVFYTSKENTYYCTDSRSFSGKTSREPVGEKCN